MMFAALILSSLCGPGCKSDVAEPAEPRAPHGRQAATAGEPPRTNRPSTNRPHLIQNGPRWAVTGLSPDAAAAVEQGRLFVIQRPIPGTPDPQLIAVFRALVLLFRSSSGVGFVVQVVGSKARRGSWVGPNDRGATQLPAGWRRTPRRILEQQD